MTIRKLGCQYVRFADGLSERVGRGVSWLTSLLVLVVCYDVFTRYLLKSSYVAVQEMEWHLFALIFLLGAAYTLKHDKHVRVDVFYARFRPRTKALVNLVGTVLFLIPFCLIGIWGTQAFIKMSFLIGETSPDPGGLPYRFTLKSVIPIGFLLVLIQGVSLAFTSFAGVMGWIDGDGVEQ
jgi:TRAP-type mannitol/chloroaromatic compound transport system permease small subunit